MMQASKRAEAGTSTPISINPMLMEVTMVTTTTPVAVPAIADRACLRCGAPFTSKRRSQVTCSEACKKAYGRMRTGTKTPSPLGPYQTPENGDSRPSQVFENTEDGVPVLDDLSEGTPLVFERINEVTVKLTDGVKIRHAGSRAWPGSDQTRALAWLMEIGWFADRQGWVVRMGDVAFGPTSFAKARAAALLMVRGGFDQLVARVTDPAAFLNSRQLELAGVRS